MPSFKRYENLSGPHYGVDNKFTRHYIRS
jgi:hypothetical protein